MVCNNIEHVCCAVLIRHGTLKLLVETPCCCSIQKYESPCAWITVLHSTQKDRRITYSCCTISEHHLCEWDELPWLVECGAASFGMSTNHGYSLLYWTATDFKEGGGVPRPPSLSLCHATHCPPAHFRAICLHYDLIWHLVTKGICNPEITRSNFQHGQTPLTLHRWPILSDSCILGSQSADRNALLDFHFSVLLKSQWQEFYIVSYYKNSAVSTSK
jgi:hypothetical protein